MSDLAPLQLATIPPHIATFPTDEGLLHVFAPFSVSGFSSLLKKEPLSPNTYFILVRRVGKTSHKPYLIGAIFDTTSNRLFYQGSGGVYYPVKFIDRPSPSDILATFPLYP